MELIGKIIHILPMQEGVKKDGNPWYSQSYVLETQGQYPKKVCYEVFGADKVQSCAAQIDEVVKVQFEPESREWNGKWFTSLKVWKVERNIDTNTPPQGMPASSSTSVGAPPPVQAPQIPQAPGASLFDQMQAQAAQDFGNGGAAEEESDLPF